MLSGRQGLESKILKIYLMFYSSAAKLALKAQDKILSTLPPLSSVRGASLWPPSPPAHKVLCQTTTDVHLKTKYSSVSYGGCCQEWNTPFRKVGSPLAWVRSRNAIQKAKPIIRDPTSPLGALTSVAELVPKLQNKPLYFYLCSSRAGSIKTTTARNVLGIT